jgi:hypothetical protein
VLLSRSFTRDQKSRLLAVAVRGQVASRPLAHWLLVLAAASPALIAAARTMLGQDVVLAVQRFLLYYAGVFALVALTGAVVIGLAGTDRIILRPGGRVVLQATHRAVSAIAVAALAVHIVLEILAHRAAATAAVVPFAAPGGLLYLGLGTLAADLLVLIMVTAAARRRFASRWPRAWRAVHALAYLMWPFAILHGLLAGRPARPDVDWSYGLCVLAVCVALLVRLAARTRGAAELRPHAVLAGGGPLGNGANGLLLPIVGQLRRDYGPIERRGPRGTADYPALPGPALATEVSAALADETLAAG